MMNGNEVPPNRDSSALDSGNHPPIHSTFTGSDVAGSQCESFTRPWLSLRDHPAANALRRCRVQLDVDGTTNEGPFSLTLGVSSVTVELLNQD